MVDKLTFMETLRSVQEIARASAEPMTREEVRSYFEGMELSCEQQELVWKYLQAPQGAFIQEGAKEAGHKGQDASSGSPKKKRHSQLFQLYLKEIEGVPAVSKAQQEALYGRLLAGEREAIGEISGQWLGKVIEIAEGYATENALLEDLVQEGNMGLLMGMEALLGRGGAMGAQAAEAELEASAKKAIEDYRQQAEGNGNAESAILAKVNLLHEAQKRLAEENGTMPTFQELAEYTNMPVAEIMDILSLPKETK